MRRSCSARTQQRTPSMRSQRSTQHVPSRTAGHLRRRSSSTVKEMSVRQESLETLFQTIGEQNLFRQQASALAVPKEGEPPALNHRPLSIQGGVMEYGFLERLQDHGVDIISPTNSALLSLIDEVNAKFVGDMMSTP